MTEQSEYIPVHLGKINYIDIKEFREKGFLQEANRIFFHPLGLALEVVIEEDGTEHLGGIWDYRDDPEGMIFAEDTINKDKVWQVALARAKHVATREKLFGGLVIQPVP